MQVVENSITIERPAEDVATDPHVTRLTMRIELMPTGAMTVLGPIIRLMMQPTAKANLVRIKAAVESG